MNQRNAGLLAIALFTLTALLHVLHSYNIFALNPGLLMGFRWITVSITLLYAFFKKSLTTWILVAMVLGVAIGLDFPEFSQNLQFLSKIFLRMVKTIVAPLLFATLVVGIASHSDLKQVDAGVGNHYSILK